MLYPNTVALVGVCLSGVCVLGCESAHFSGAVLAAILLAAIEILTAEGALVLRLSPLVAAFGG